MVSTASTKETSATMEVVSEIKPKRLVAAFNALLDMHRHERPPRAFTYAGPAQKLIQMMREKLDGDRGLPLNGTELIAWLRAPGNGKVIVAAGIMIVLFPDPRGPSQTGHSDHLIAPVAPMVRLERLVPGADYVAGQIF